VLGVESLLGYREPTLKPGLSSLFFSGVSLSIFNKSANDQVIKEADLQDPRVG
jgi:hypothetical protein